MCANVHLTYPHGVFLPENRHLAMYAHIYYNKLAKWSIVVPQIKYASYPCNHSIVSEK